MSNTSAIRAGRLGRLMCHDDNPARTTDVPLALDGPIHRSHHQAGLFNESAELGGCVEADAHAPGFAACLVLVACLGTLPPAASETMPAAREHVPAALPELLGPASGVYRLIQSDKQALTGPGF